MKKWLVALGMTICLLGLTACGQKEEVTYMTDSDAVSLATQAYQLVSQVVAEGQEETYVAQVELSGEDGRFYDATAITVENKIEVTSTKVLNPVYVRYGFSRSPFLDIYNKDGYLMSPFRNDDYDKNIDILDYDDPSLYKRDPNGANHTISINNNNLVISKPASQLSYCASNIYRWSPVNHTGTKFRFVYQGTNSGVEIQIRFIESSYEIWSFSFMDDSSEKTIKEVTITDNLICTYNQINNYF